MKVILLHGVQVVTSRAVVAEPGGEHSCNDIRVNRDARNVRISGNNHRSLVFARTSATNEPQ